LFGSTVLKKIGITPNLKVLIIPLLSVSIMAIFIYTGFVSKINVIFQILIAGFVYSAIFFILKRFSKTNYSIQ
jgi:hypothetical protein